MLSRARRFTRGYVGCLTRRTAPISKRAARPGTTRTDSNRIIAERFIGAMRDVLAPDEARQAYELVRGLRDAQVTALSVGQDVRHGQAAAIGTFQEGQAALLQAYGEGQSAVLAVYRDAQSAYEQQLRQSSH